MTIAATFLSTEGVVFGADSTASVPVPISDGHETFVHYNHAQKIFQVGSGESTLGIVIWGLNGFEDISFRTMIAKFAEINLQTPASDLREVAERFAIYFWGLYVPRYQQEIEEVKEWVSRGEISEAEAAHLQSLLNRSSGGFFLGGNLYHDRTPFVYEIKYDPVRSAPGISSVHMGEVRFRGMANAFQRLTMGIDPNLVEEILRSKFWTGGEDRFRELIQRYTWLPPSLPIRDAIDWVHASVYSTIKAMKFSSQPPTCGGPVELAVITTDRPFRWVEHKKLNVAIGGNSNG